MSTPVKRTTSGVSASAPIPLNIHAKYFSATAAGYVTGTVAVTLQFTMDDPFATDLSSATWINHPDATGQTANFAVAFVSPVTAVRLNQTSGSGSCLLTVIQSGHGR